MQINVFIPVVEVGQKKGGDTHKFSMVLIKWGMDFNSFRRGCMGIFLKSGGTRQPTLLALNI